MAGNPITVIFDLGNVILPFDPLKPCRVLARETGNTPDEVADLIYGHGLERAFEEGKIDGRVFTRECGRVLGIKLEYQRFRNLWADMFTENQAVSALIQWLHSRYPLVLLSNTNVWHWEHALAKYPILGCFSAYVLSYEVGVLKPDIAIYQAARRCVPDGSEAVFIDDIPANAEGAAQAGIHGIQFTDVDRLVHDLTRFGIDIPSRG
ncbi:MAG: HAD family phosphatase [candidate division Zixibacteria bacterium]|nr:HAD family phosphatase [candidate division Zixibacteria bacterium]